MAQEELDLLLTRMSAIAEAVNAFNSEAVQHEAFSALIAAFEGKHHGVKQRAETESEDPAQGKALTLPKSANGIAKAKRASKASRSEWGMVKELDLNPVGKTSFQEFIAKKDPRSNEDKYPVVIYYLSTVLEIPKVTIGHVGSVFRLTKSWKEPTNLAGGLGVASSRKGTIDTSSYEDIKITPAGRNFVEHDLPRPKAKK